MNELIADVIHIQNNENLHIVTFGINETRLSMMSLELDRLHQGSTVRLSIKPMNIALGKNISGTFSFINQLSATIKEVRVGMLLCSILVDFQGIELESIITKTAYEHLALKPQEHVTLFIKASDLSIKEVIQ